MGCGECDGNPVGAECSINGNGPLTLGLLYCCSGLGTGLGPLLVRRWVGKEFRNQLWAILGGLLALSLGILELASPIQLAGCRRLFIYFRGLGIRLQLGLFGSNFAEQG